MSGEYRFAVPAMVDKRVEQWEGIAFDDGTRGVVVMRDASGVEVASGEGASIWDALRSVRGMLEGRGIRLGINGARVDVRPSPMMLQSNSGIRPYLLVEGVPASPSLTVDLFAAAPFSKVGTVEEQDAYSEAWMERNAALSESVKDGKGLHSWVGDRIEGAVYAFAFGDAWGRLTEFMDYAAIERERPEPGEVLAVTDDTQMSLYTLAAVAELLERFGAGGLAMLGVDEALQREVRRVFMKQYVRFGYDPDNNRAPGMTCMREIEAVERGVRDAGLAAENASLGCGTIMRAPWLGLLDLPEETIVALSVLQAQTTHGHPKGWVASASCSLVVARLLRHRWESGVRSAAFVLEAVDDAVASPLLARFGAEGAELRRELEALQDAQLQPSWGAGNPCELFGEGWIANETLTVAWAVFAYRTNPVASIRHLVYTSGDSDSLAAVGGAFVGAYEGFAALNFESKGRFEPRYERELAEAISFIKSTYGPPGKLWRGTGK